MSDWGDDYDDAPSADDVAPGRPGGPGKARAFGIDIGDAAAAYVDAAVSSQIKKQIADVAAEAVEAALTEEVLERLREQSAAAAQRALEAQFDADEADTEPAAAESDQEDEDDEPQLMFGSVDEFVRVWLRHTYKRRVDGSKTLWAADWWRYTEAVNRLDVLWRAWEQMRREPGASMSSWWRDHADHHMTVLLSDTGPFKAAPQDEKNTCKASEPLPYTAPPEGLFLPEPHEYRAPDPKAETAPLVSPPFATASSTSAPTPSDSHSGSAGGAESATQLGRGR